MKTFTIPAGVGCLELGRKTRIMGVLNITPDSFSDGGLFFSPESALRQAEKLVRDGADIIDIGGESTRPFSEAVPAEEEIRRVVPVIDNLARRIPVPISIDTTKAVVAKAALDAGAAIINDVGAFRLDPEMVDIAVAFDVPVIVMHMKGTPKNMQVDPCYDDLTGEILQFLQNVVNQAVKKGIKRSRLIIDPGIGFGKTVAHNLALINRLSDFEKLELPILVGPSRKAFIRNLLKEDAQKDIDPLLPIVESGTQAAVAASILNGAHIVRVHNVATTAATIKIADAIRQS